MKRTSLVGLFLAFVMLWSETSQCACGLSLTANDIVINWDTNFSHIAVQLQIDKAGPDPCDFGLGFTKGGGASYVSRRGVDGAGLIRYQLYQDNGLTKILKDVPDITSTDDVVQGGFQAGSNMTQAVNYYFEIPYNLAVTPALVPAGTYTDSFVINLYEGSDPLAFATPDATRNVNVTINVPTMIDLSIVDSGGGFVEGSTIKNINFGTLSEGQSHTVDLRVRTNAGFDVTFSSANNGYLKHMDATKNSAVPYKFYANGMLLDLSSSATVPVSGLSAPGQTSLSGLAYPLKIVIGNVTSGGKMGGPHADSITITATTTE